MPFRTCSNPGTDMKYWPTKTSAEVKDYGLNWGPTLSKFPGRSIVASEWTRLRGTAVAGSGSLDADGRHTYTRVLGGDPNTDSTFRNTVTLDDGSIFDEDVLIKTRA
jgi:hypothetical protein